MYIYIYIYGILQMYMRCQQIRTKANLWSKKYKMLYYVISLIVFLSILQDWKIYLKYVQVIAQHVKI